MLSQLKVKQALQVLQKRQKVSSIPETEEPVVTSEAKNVGRGCHDEGGFGIKGQSPVGERAREQRVEFFKCCRESQGFCQFYLSNPCLSHSLEDTLREQVLGHAESLTGDAMLRLLSG